MNSRKQQKPAGPLTEQHLKVLDKVIALCDETLEYCKKCDACNLDVDAERKKTEEQREMARLMKATFFPHSR